MYNANKLLLLTATLVTFGANGMGNPEDLSQSSDESDSLAPSAQESGLVELQSPEELNEALGAALLRALNEANSALYGCGSGFAT